MKQLFDKKHFLRYLNRLALRGFDTVTHLRRLMLRVVDAVIIFVSIATPLGVVYMFGFPQSQESRLYIEAGYQSFMTLMWMAMTIRVLFGKIYDEGNNTPQSRRRSRNRRLILVGVYVVLTIITLISFSLRYRRLVDGTILEVVNAPWLIIVTLSVVSFIELSRLMSGILSRKVNPTTILAGSFMLIILIGSALLHLPNCTYNGISYIDSFFTATSAVCVTGLSSVGTAETFTTTGQVVILLLIQIGGLGIMTITSFFGLFFMGRTSIKSRLLLGDLLSSDKMGGLGRALIKIVMVTLSVEAVGAILLYGVVDNQPGISAGGGAFFFSVFHSISAFCNAGFSTLPGNLYDPAVRHLWSVPMIISWLVIFGGIGFPIFSNILSILKRFGMNCLRLLGGRPLELSPRQLSLNSYIVLKTTAILVMLGWVYMLIAEWNHSLAEFSFMGKLSQGFLAAVTPRTAGFNGVDVGSMLPVTLMVMMVLMWIGGAPQSTAGGIKVTTFYLAIKNVRSILLGKKSIDAYKRKISSDSVRRAFATIMVSLCLLGLSLVVLRLLEPSVSMSALAFEAVSALSTVGLSLGVTSELGMSAKLVLVLLMFVGRIGVLSILYVMVRNSSRQPYVYPSEDILIN